MRVFKTMTRLLQLCTTYFNVAYGMHSLSLLRIQITHCLQNASVRSRVVKTAHFLKPVNRAEEDRLTVTYLKVRAVSQS